MDSQGRSQADNLEIYANLRSNSLLLAKGPTACAFQEYRKMAKRGSRVDTGVQAVSRGALLGRSIVETTLNFGNIGKKKLSELGNIVEVGVNRSIGRRPVNAAPLQEEWSDNSTPRNIVKPVRYGDILFLSPAYSDISGSGHRAFHVGDGLLTTEPSFMRRSHVEVYRSENDMEHPWLSLFRIIPASKSTSNKQSKTNTAQGDSLQPTYGQPLHQGETFALQQVGTNIFLSACADTFADIEKDCARLSIATAESADVFFTLRTKFNLRRGGPVYYADQVIITHVKLLRDLHVGGPQSQYGAPGVSKLGNLQRIEVNLSHPIKDSKDVTDRGTSSWRLHYYGPTAPDSLCGGTLVRIEHLHVNGYLWGSCNASMFDRPFFSQRQVVTGGTFGSGASTPLPALVFNKAPQFSLNDPSAISSVKTVFRIENLSVLDGKIVAWNDDLRPSDNLFRLRHVATGCYLSVARGGTGSSSYSAKLAKLSKWREVSPEETVQFLYSTLFRFRATAEGHGQWVQWKDCTLRIEHVCIPPPRARHATKVLAAFAAGIVLLEVDGVCVPYSRKCHTKYLSVNAVASLSVESSRPRTKKTPYPGIARTHCQADSSEFASRSMDAVVPHKAIVQFLYAQKECDVVQLHAVPDVDAQLLIAALIIHNYFDIVEDSCFLQIPSRRASVTAQSPPDRGASFFQWHPDMLREIETTLKMLSLFVRSEKVHPTVPVDDVYVKGATAADIALVDSSGREVRMRNQIAVANTSVLDRLFWFLQLPELFGRNMEADVQMHTRRLYALANYVIMACAWGNPIVQDYVARSCFRGWRTSGCFDKVTEFEEKTATAEQGTIPDGAVGYLRYVTDLLGRNPFAPTIYQYVVMENRSLMNTLLCETFVQDCINVLRRKGPSDAILELLASIAFGAGNAIIGNQNMVLDALYATGDNKRFQDNRLGLLIETLYWDDVDTAATCELSPESSIFVSWNGSDGYVLGDNLGSELFYDPATLKLPSYNLPPTLDQKQYFKRIGLNCPSINWVNLVDLAWYVDPPNCCNFWLGDPKLEWAKIMTAIKSDHVELERVSHLRMISSHCLGVYDVVSKLCCQRSYRPIRALERQFCYNLCACSFVEKKLPSSFRRVMCDILKNLYIDRRPNAKMVVPFPFRFDIQIQNVDNTDSALAVLSKWNTMVGDSFEGVGMDSEVEVMGEKMAYKDYLARYQNIIVSTDVDKFCQIQDGIAEYFLGSLDCAAALPHHSKLVHLCPRNIRGGSELDNFRCSLSMLEAMLAMISMGYYNTSSRLREGIMIVSATLQTHRHRQHSNYRRSLDDSRDSGSETSEEENDPHEFGGSNKSTGDEAPDVSGPYVPLVDSDAVSGTDGGEGYLPLKLEYLPGSPKRDQPVHSRSGSRRGIAHSGGDATVTVRNIPTSTQPNTIWEKDMIMTRGDLKPDNLAEKAERRGVEFTRICRRHDNIKVPDIVVEHIIENQRWYGISYHLETVLSHRGPFTSPNPALLVIFKHDFPVDGNNGTNKGLPDASWLWLDEWYVQTVMQKAHSSEYMRATSSEGWFYALDWAYEFSEKKVFSSNVRCRRWERTRRQKTAEEFIDFLLDRGYSRQALMQICNNGNISEDGIFNFENILHELQNISVGHGLESGMGRNLQVDGSVYVDLDTEDQIRIASAKCLTTSLDIFDVATSVFIDTRVTRAKRIFHSTSPPALVPTEGSSIGDDPPLWVVEQTSPSERRVVLTAEGEEVLLGIFAEGNNKLRAANPTITKNVLSVMLEDDHALCDKAIRVLRRTAEQTREFVQYFQDCIILPSEEYQSAAKQLCSTSRLLRNDLPYFFQMTVRSSCTLGVAKNISLLRESMIVSSKSSRPSPLLQNIMREMKGYVPVVQVVLHGVFSRHGHVTEECVQTMTPLWNQAREFLETFCYDNELNKRVVLPAVPLLLKGVSVKFPGHNTVIRIIETAFRDINPMTAGVPTEDIIANVIRVIVTDKMECGVVHRITKLLKHLIAPKGEPHRKHQDIVLQEMIAGSNKYKVELFDVRRYRANPRPELMALIAEYSRTYSIDTSLDCIDVEHIRVKDMRVLFHAECVQILALCCLGRRKATAAAKCMSILPFESIIEVLSCGATYSCPPLALAYGLFLRHVFLDSDTDTLQIAMEESSVNITEYKPMWETCSHFCAFAADRANLTNAFRPFVFEVVLPCLQLFLVSYINEQAASNIVCNDSDGYADVVILGTKRIVAHLLNEESLAQSEMVAVNKAAVALGVRRGDYETVNTHPRPTTAGVNIDPGEGEACPDSPASAEIEMVDNPALLQSKSIDAGRIGSVLNSLRRKSGTDMPAQKQSTEQTCEFIGSMVKNCPRIRKIIESEFESFVDLLLQGEVLEDGSGAQPAHDSATASRSNRSDVETSTQYDILSSVGTIHQGFLAFGTFANRMIRFAREEIVKQKAEVLSDDDAFLAFGTTYFPMPVKLTGVVSPSTATTYEYGEKLHIKNVLFVFRVLTLALRRQRLREEQESGVFGGGMAEEPTGNGPSFTDMQLIMARSQAPALIVEALSYSRYPTLTSAVLTFGTELFANGFRVCQDSLLDFLTHSRACGHFFDRLEHIISTITQARRDVNALRNAALESADAEGYETPMETHYFRSRAPPAQAVYELFRFLQLLCEGHYAPMQELLDAHSGLRTGLLTATLHLLNEYIPTMEDIRRLRLEDGAVIYAVLTFLAESVQGPCYKNQELLASLPIFWETIDRIWRYSSHQWDMKKEKLHKTINMKCLLLSQGDQPLGFRGMKIIKVMAMILRCSLIEGRKPTHNDPVFKVLMMYDYRESVQGLKNSLNELRMVERSYRNERYGPRKMTRALNFVLEEIYLTCSLARSSSRLNPEWYKSFLPTQPSVVRRRHYASEKEYAVAMKDYKEATRRFNLFSTISENLRSIEVMWAGKGLFLVNFVLPWKCKFLSKEMKDNLIGSIDYTSDDKVAYFLDQTRTTSLEMSLKMDLEEKHLQSVLWFQDELATAIFAVTVLINFVMVISLEKGYFTGNSSPQYVSSSFQSVMVVLVWMQFLLCLYRFFQHALIRVPLIFEEWRHQRQRMLALGKSGLTRSKKIRIATELLVPFYIGLAGGAVVNGLLYIRYDSVNIPVAVTTAAVVFVILLRSLYSISRQPWIVRKAYAGWFIMLVDVIQDRDLKFDILFMVLAIFCLDRELPYLNSLMLLFIVKQSGTLQNVVKAVTLPIQSLAMSALLGFICILIFTVFGFYFLEYEFFNPNQSADECSSLVLCLATFLHGGFLSGGGIADHIKGDLGHELLLSNTETLTARVAYDISFFVIIIILLLNIIFGIIIDTFGQLREEAAEKADIMASYCFICGISKDVFDARAANGAIGGVGGLNFSGHITSEHNMWDYMFFLVYLQEKDSNEYTGIESYVASLAADGDISWVPKGVALGVSDATELESGLAEKKMAQNFRSASESIQSFLGDAMQTLLNAQIVENDRVMSILHKLEVEIGVLKRKVEASQ